MLDYLCLDRIYAFASFDAKLALRQTCRDLRARWPEPLLLGVHTAADLRSMPNTSFATFICCIEDARHYLRQLLRIIPQRTGKWRPIYYPNYQYVNQIYYIYHRCWHALDSIQLGCLCSDNLPLMQVVCPIGGVLRTDRIFEYISPTIARERFEKKILKSFSHPRSALCHFLRTHLANLWALNRIDHEFKLPEFHRSLSSLLGPTDPQITMDVLFQNACITNNATFVSKEIESCVSHNSINFITGCLHLAIKFGCLEVLIILIRRAYGFNIDDVLIGFKPGSGIIWADLLGKILIVKEVGPKFAKSFFQHHENPLRELLLSNVPINLKYIIAVRYNETLSYQEKNKLAISMIADAESIGGLDEVTMEFATECAHFFDFCQISKLKLARWSYL
jgi:hypothetical protein